MSSLLSKEADIYFTRAAWKRLEDSGGQPEQRHAKFRVRALLVAYDAEWDSKEGMICKESAVARDLKEGGYAAYWTGCAMRLSEADLNQPFDKVIIDRCFAELRNGSLIGVKCAALCGPVQVSGQPNTPDLMGKDLRQPVKALIKSAAAALEGTPTEVTMLVKVLPEGSKAAAAHKKQTSKVPPLAVWQVPRVLEARPLTPSLGGILSLEPKTKPKLTLPPAPPILPSPSRVSPEYVAAMPFDEITQLSNRFFSELSNRFVATQATSAPAAAATEKSTIPGAVMEHVDEPSSSGRCSPQ